MKFIVELPDSSRIVGCVGIRSFRGHFLGRSGLLLAVAAISTFSARAQMSEPPTIRTPEAFAETPPLSSIQPIVPLGPVAFEVGPRNTLPPWLNFGGPTPITGAPPASSVLQQELGPLAMPTLVQSWEGNGIGLSGFTMSGAPPDTEGDVGPNHYVQWVNSMFAIWNKTGTLLYGPANGNTLFSTLGGRCSTDNNGDPLVMYDAIADRWFMSQLAVSKSPFYQCVAVSKTADPTGAWYTWAFNYGTSFNDYGKSGVWPDGYYIMYHMFLNGNSWLGTEVCALDRVSMLAGTPTASQQCFGPNPNYGGLLPSHLNLAGSHLPPGGAPNYYLAFGASGQLLLWPFHVDWTTPANSTFGTGGTFVPKSLTVAAFNEPCNGFPSACVPQSGTTTRLDTLGDRLMWRLNYRNFSDHESLVVTHSIDTGSNAPTGIRWYEIRSPGATSPTVFQQGTYSPDSAHRFMGSVNMDRAGNIAVGYSVSSSSMNPAIRYAGRLAGDPSGQLSQGEATQFAGTGSQTTFNSAHCYSTGGGANPVCPLTRWGDYSTMSVDPSDGCTFWYTTEYLASNGAFNWQTRIASFQFPGCTACPTIQGTVSGGGTICSGGTSTVTVAVSGGTPPYSVTLNNGGGTLAGAGPTFHFSVSPVSTTTYAVQTLTDVNSCAGSGIGSATVTVNPAPATPVISAPSTVSPLQAFTASVPSVAGVSYAWNVTNGSITSGTGTDQIGITAGSTGAVSISVTETNLTTGCVSATGSATVGIAIPAVAATFVPLSTPCRAVDTRSPGGYPISGGRMAAGETRSFALPSSSCGIPSNALAYSLNATVVPPGTLGYLSLWPSGQPRPLVSTLNSPDGRIKANAAIVPAGTSGAVSAYVTDPTDLILDIDGYFVQAGNGGALAFYPLSPCRISDTRNPLGPYGGPTMSAGQTRTTSTWGVCGIPSGAQALSLNFTVVPQGPLGYLTTWPTGQPQPLVSTLNAPTGTVVANAAIVPTSASGQINVYVTNTTDVVIDVNGYFAPTGSAGALSFYAATPCRVSDTRLPTGPFGGPQMTGGSTRSWTVPASSCSIPSSAQAYSLNATVVPVGPLGYLTLWPTGITRPLVSTLNAQDGALTSNAAIVPAGTSGAINAYVTNSTNLILDINGYFAP